ncbi:MAG: ubiquitin-like small modifier protein 1 [Haloarculaceae archaeon]
MEVEVRLFATFREAVGERAIRREVGEGATVGDLLRGLEREYADLDGTLLDADGSVRASITVLRNGENVARSDGTGTALRDGDRVALSLPVTGGTAARADQY